MTRMTFRRRFRAFQEIRGENVDPEFVADLEFLENRDLDLSIRNGGMLAFNALLITIGTHPISASPGAPLSLDAPTQPLLTVASIIGIIPFILSSYFCLRAILLGEEFETDAIPDQESGKRALFAAFILSIDTQDRLLRYAIRATLIGGVLTMAVWVWILLDKMLG
jgi:hypothetical protein